MNKTICITSGIVCLIASLVCLFFNWKISTGIIIGLISSLVYFLLLNKTFKVKEDGSFSKGGIIAFLLRIVILALPLLIACLLPNIFNIFGAFAGILLFRIVMIVFFFREKGEM